MARLNVLEEALQGRALDIGAGKAGIRIGLCNGPASCFAIGSEPFRLCVDGVSFLRLLLRILFFAHINGKFVLLHHFRKRTRKTPKRELECAQKRMLDYTKREGENHGDEFQ